MLNINKKVVYVYFVIIFSILKMIVESVIVLVSSYGIIYINEFE